MKIKLFVAIALTAVALFAGEAVSAQVNEKKDEAAPMDYTKDTETIDSIIAALYDSISGGPNVKRDWARFNNLFHPDARLIPTGKSQSTGLYNATTFTPDGYVKRSEPFMMQNGFFEKEIARKTVRFGNIVHVFSTYEGRNKETDEKAFLRGINSIQLLFDGKRWWVVTVYWQAETPDNPLPAEFLP